MIYQPSEDTFLIEEQVKLFAKDKTVLDMGTGSGYLAISALNSGAKSVMAIDINKNAIDSLKKRKENIKAVHSNLFDKITQKFDLIVFNPPYLPLDENEDKASRLATTGGKKGDEIIVKFLKGAKSHLNENGIILLLLSSLTPRDRINNLLKEMGFNSTQLSLKPIFFESLEVVKIQKH